MYPLLLCWFGKNSQLHVALINSAIAYIDHNAPRPTVERSETELLMIVDNVWLLIFHSFIQLYIV